MKRQNAFRQVESMSRGSVSQDTSIGTDAIAVDAAGVNGRLKPAVKQWHTLVHRGTMGHVQSSRKQQQTKSLLIKLFANSQTY